MINSLNYFFMQCECDFILPDKCLLFEITLIISQPSYMYLSFCFVLFLGQSIEGDVENAKWRKEKEDGYRQN